MCPSKAWFLEGIKWLKKPVRIHAKSLSDALAPSKKDFDCGARLRRLYEASSFIAGVPVVCQIFARTADSMGKGKRWVGAQHLEKLWRWGHHCKYRVSGGQEDNSIIWVGPPHQIGGNCWRCSIIHIQVSRKIGTVRTHCKKGMVAYLGGVPSLCLGAVIILVHVWNITSQRKHKLECLKSKSKGVANEMPTCVVPMHAPQTSSLWQGVGEVSSACEVGWTWMEGTTKALNKARQGVAGVWHECLKLDWRHCIDPC